MSNLSLSQLKQAISIKEEIAKLESKLAAIFGDGKFAAGTKPAKAMAAPKARGVFKRSPQTIARMKAAAKKRWAKIKGTAAAAKPAAPVAKKKGTMSPEARAKLAAAMKARWAARKKGAAAPNAKKK